MLRQLILLRILDGHARDLVAAPVTIALGRRRRIRTDTREDTSSRLVHQPVLIRQVIRKLRPHADLLALVVALTTISTSGQTNRSVSVKETGRTIGIDIRCHLDRKVTVRIRLGVVHRRRVLSVLTLVPLGVNLDALKRLTRVLHVTETNTGLNNLLDRTRDRTFLVCLTRRINGLACVSRCLGRRLLRIRVPFSKRRSSKLRSSHRLRERRNQRKRQRSRSHRRAATTSDVILLHRKFLPRK